MNATTLQKIDLTIPEIDLSLFSQLAEKMHWSFSLSNKPGIEEGLKDLKEGRVYHATNAQDMLNQILG